LGQLVLAILFAPLARRLLPNVDTAQEIGDVIASVQSTVVLTVIIVSTVVLAPVVEELMFRGVLLKAMGDRSPKAIMVVTALVFAAFHLVGLDPDTFLPAAAVVFPQLVIVGAALAWVTLRNGRLGPAIMLHSGFNLVAAIAILAVR
jgi:membrane protease YdiL (CAAX protease family)